VKPAGPLWLASASPRRRELLAAAGIHASIQPPDINDGVLSPGRTRPEHWVLAMAHLKARRVVLQLLERGGCEAGTVLGADTVCAHDGSIMGQPRDAAHAAWMLHRMRDATHETLTGIALIDLLTGARRLWVERAAVIIGALTDPQIDSYVASGAWRGKAGAYNLQERIDAGWPISCSGDPTTVMGLPMRRLTALLRDGTAA
jgi:septum formation protein